MLGRGKKKIQMHPPAPPSPPPPHLWTIISNGPGKPVFRFICSEAASVRGAVTPELQQGPVCVRHGHAEGSGGCQRDIPSCLHLLPRQALLHLVLH